MNSEEIEKQYFHWVFGENILREDNPVYLINLEHGVSFRFEYQEVYFATFEEFSSSLADTQFLSGNRPAQDVISYLIIEAWNFLALVEREEENYHNEEDYL